MKKLVLMLILFQMSLFASNVVQFNKKIITLIVKNDIPTLEKLLNKKGFIYKLENNEKKYTGVVGEIEFFFSFFKNQIYVEGIKKYPINDYESKREYNKYRKMILSSFESKLISEESEPSSSKESGNSSDQCITKSNGWTTDTFEINKVSVSVSYELGYNIKCYKYYKLYSDISRESKYRIIIQAD